MMSDLIKSLITISTFITLANFVINSVYFTNAQRQKNIQLLKYANVDWLIKNYKSLTHISIDTDPVWVPTGSCVCGDTTSNFFTTTMLPNGNILAVGRHWQIYDYLSGTWSTDNLISRIRNSINHTATLLPNGLVLIAGGEDPNTSNRAEIFDPLKKTWTATGNLNLTRRWHSATLLPNGKVLVAGGDSQYIGRVLDEVELYDPNKEVWILTGKMKIPRRRHTAVLLHNDKVLVFGGYNDSSLTSAELYDPTTGVWTRTGNLIYQREDATATLLANGMVLVAGGNVSSNPTDSAELYDPIKETWSLTGHLGQKRTNHTATLLNNGMVLIAGGRENSSSTLSSSELYNPATGTWTITSPLIQLREKHAANLLPNGKVVIAGGYNVPTPGVSWPGSNKLNTAEIYDLSFQSNPIPIVTSLKPDWVLKTSDSLNLYIVGSNFTNGSIVRLNDSDRPTIFVSGSQLISLVYSSDTVFNGEAKVSVYTPAPGGGGSNTALLPIVNNVVNVSAASYSPGGIAPDSLIAAFGVNLSSATQAATSLPLPESLAGTKVVIKDRLGVERNAPLLYVSPTQINYLVPLSAAIGDGSVIITNFSKSVAAERIRVQSVNPAIFSANRSGQGVVAGQVLRIKADGSHHYELAFKYDNVKDQYTFEPINMGPFDDQVFLILYGTGMRNVISLSNISVNVGGMPAQVLYGGAQGYYAGLDQLNIRLPRTLIGRGVVDVVVTVNNIAANNVQAFIK